MSTLIIARHGNTFDAGDTPTRVGARTDLPLVEKGFAQGRAIGAYLHAHDFVPDMVYASGLQRTQQTARAALDKAGIERDIKVHAMFNEIDYGPDENKTEDEVIARLGAQAITDWDDKAVVPDGWVVDPQGIIKSWIDFAAQCIGRTTLVVTSNGTARFAPHITGDFEGFSAKNNIKLSTGALAVLRHDGARWSIEEWNIKP